MHGANGAWVGKADVCALEVFYGQLVCAHLANDFVVCKQEACKVKCVGITQHWNNECALTFALVYVNRKTNVDVVVLLNLRLTVCIGEVTVLHVWNSVGDSANNGVTNDVRETDFWLTRARAVVVHDLAVHFQQLGWHIAETGCGWNREALFHVGCNCCRHSAQ